MVCFKSPWAVEEGSRDTWSKVRKEISYIVLTISIRSEGDNKTAKDLKRLCLESNTEAEELTEVG